MGPRLFGRAAQNHSWSIAGILGLLIITALSSIPLTLTVLPYREADALVIDMAGRQRMLLERYMKELLLAAQGAAVRHQDTRDLLEQRLRVLIDGGSTSSRGQAYVDQAQYLRVFVGLRKKIEKQPARLRFILTDPGVGYRFCTDPDG